MKKHIRKQIPLKAPYEEYARVRNEDAVEGFEILKENMPEIREIFRVQLDKPGHVYREFATEEIIKYLYQNRIDKMEKGGVPEHFYWDYMYARTLYELADIIKAVNDEDEKAFDEAMKVLPWGDSNTGDQLSWNTATFAYAIMSDEARERFGSLFYKYVEQSNMGRNNPDAKIEEMAELGFLPELVEFNQETAKEIKSMKKPSQPGEEQ